MDFIEAAWEQWSQSDDGAVILASIPSPGTAKLIFTCGMRAGFAWSRQAAMDVARQVATDFMRGPSDTDVAIAVAKARELDAEAKDYERYFG